MTRIMIAVMLALSWVAGARAAAIHVKPTMTLFPPGQSAAVITVTNQGDAPLNAQVRIFGWDQGGEGDILGPTSSLVASPPMVSLAPRQSQSIRLVRTARTRPAAVEAYRLLVDEITDGTPLPQSGVALQMRYSLPVFVLPRDNLKPAQLTLTASVADTVLTLAGRNVGEAYAQATNVSLEFPNKVSVPLVSGLLGYVLPGKSTQWKVPIPPSASRHGKPTGVRMMVNGRDMQVDF